LHFIPFLAFVILEAFYFYSPGTLGYARLTPYSRAALQLVSLCSYGVLAWKTIRNDLELRSLKSFVAGLVGGEIIVIVTLAVMVVYYGRFPDVRLLFVALTLFIYWISYKQIERPDLFILKGQSPALQLQVKNFTKYNHSSLKPEEANRIATLLKNVMQQERLYLNSDLSIDSLARHLNVSRHHISQVLNERFQLTYSDYVNDLRLAEVKSRLQNSRHNHFSIAAIAMDSGFSSVSNFNELFKRKFGKTPSQCRTEGLGKMTA
jgi:AraC-like DNA-binding protein